MTSELPLVAMTMAPHRLTTDPADKAGLAALTAKCWTRAEIVR
jgi:hypothetical protein